MVFEDLGLLFFTSLILSLFLTPATIRFAQRIGAVDTPVDRSVHTRIMPRMGGLGMAAAACVSLILFIELNPMLLGFLLGVGIIVATGVWDDLRGVRPAVKMLGQILACVVFLMLSGLSLHSFGNILGIGSIDFSPTVAFFVSLFCMVGIINAFNLSDGLDGLAAGITIIAALFMLILALEAHQQMLVFILVAIMGVTFGFLKFNTYPAKLFMGDTGSLSLGFFMAAALMFLVEPRSGSHITPITIAIILALPIVDTVWVMTRRILQGKSPVSADKTHLHHRLLALGLPHAAVVAVIYTLSFLFGLLAILLHAQPEWIQLWAGVSAVVLVYSVLGICEKMGVNIGQWSWVRYGHEHIDLLATAGKSVKGLRVAVLLGLVFPIGFVDAAPEATQQLLLGVLLLLLVAYPWKEHTERLNIVYGLFYLVGISILYVWHVSSYTHFSLLWYVIIFTVVLFVWSMFKVMHKGHHEVFLTSGLEMILIFLSWFVPFVLLPVLDVSDTVMSAAKMACLQAIPLLIAMKIIIRRHPDRNYMMVAGLTGVLSLMLWVL